jgi:hypothetical protein
MPHSLQHNILFRHCRFARRIRHRDHAVLADTLFPTVDVTSPATGALVARFTNVTTSPAGRITLTDTVNFAAGTTYRLWYELPNGDFGAEKVVAS